MPKPRRQRERGFQRVLLAWCAEHLHAGVVWLHIENEDVSGGGFARWMARMLDGLLPGAPDLVFFWEGKSRFLELKDEDGEVSEGQDKCHQRLRGAGCPVEVVWSLEEAQAVLRQWGLVRG